MESVRRMIKGSYRVVSISFSRGYWKRGGLGLAIARRDYEALHYAYVSPEEVKCSCMYSIRKAARADRVLRELGMPEVASKYALCKHTLAAIAKLVALNEIDLRKTDLKKLLLRCTAVTFLFVEPLDRARERREIIRRALFGSYGGGESSSP